MMIVNTNIKYINLICSTNLVLILCYVFDMFSIPMITWTYTKTPVLLESLQTIDKLYLQLHGLILSREAEMKRQWSARINRVYFALSLYDLSVTKKSVSEVLVKGTSEKSSAPQQEITHFSDALHYLNYHWYVRDKQITFDDLADIYHLVWNERINRLQFEIDDHLRYIQESNEHPLVQAALAQAVFYNIQAFPAKNELFSHLVFYLFTVKTGWNLRDLVVIENKYFHERVYYKDLIREGFAQGNLSSWVEYVIEGCIQEMQHAIDEVHQFSAEALSQPVFILNDRQKKVLAYLDQPGMVIQNKKLQQMCHVSPMTAARDLSALVQLGLIYPKGKGRGVTYSRV